jgi:Cdc6-like AAA superfamily ATPase
MHNFEKTKNSNPQAETWAYDPVSEQQRREVIADKVEQICEREKLSPDVGKIAVESCVNAIGKTTDVLQLIDHLAPDVAWLDCRVNADIPKQVLDKSYLLIGPMGTGKSTIARNLAEQTKMPKVSLDSRADLPNEWQYAERRRLGTESRDAYITASALTALKEPTIVDFGAGDSVYDDPLIKHEMDTLISRFKNVVLILPDSDRSASLAYLNGRVRNREPSRRGFESDNGRFVYAPNNQELATRTVYTNFGDKPPEEMAREIASLDAVE